MLKLNNIFYPVLTILTGLLFGIIFLLSSSQVMWSIIIATVSLGILSVRFSMIPLILFFMGTLFIPREVLPILSNTEVLYGFGPIRLHPVMITIFIGSSFVLLIRKSKILQKLYSSKTLRNILILISIFCFLILLQTFLFRGLAGIPQCLENYIIPFIFFLYLLTIEPSKILKFMKYYIFVILLLAFFGLFEYIFRYNFIYGHIYSNIHDSWYLKFIDSGYRITTTIGHPLKNSVYFLFALPISLFLYKKPFNLLVAFVLSLAILVTGSRSGFILGVIVILLCNMDITLNIFKLYKTLFIFIFIILLFYFVLFYSPLGQTLLPRFHVSHKSTLVRLTTLKNCFPIIKSSLLLGKGMGLSFELSSELLGEKGIGFENPWIMLIADVGFITAMIYIFTIFLVVFSTIRFMKSKNINRGIFLSFASILLAMSFFNSFGDRNTLNVLLWFNISLLYV